MNEHDAGTTALARRRELRRLVPVLVLGQLVAIVVAVVLLLVFGDDLFGDDSGGSDGGAVWQIAIWTALGFLVVANLVVFLVFRWQRRRGSALFATSPLFELPRQRDRKALVRALRRGDPIAPEQVELARRTAQDLVGRHRLVWLYVGLAVLFAGNGSLQLWLAIIDSESLWAPVSYISFGTAVLMLTTAGYFAWLMRRMQEALARLNG